jgi:hypothetical protein
MFLHEEYGGVKSTLNDIVEPLFGYMGSSMLLRARVVFNLKPYEEQSEQPRPYVSALTFFTEYTVYESVFISVKKSSGHFNTRPKPMATLSTLSDASRSPERKEPVVENRDIDLLALMVND